MENEMNPAREALSRAVNRAIANGAPVYVNQPATDDIDVRILVGAHAYATVTEGNRKTDFLLSAGKSAQASLREYATEQRERVQRILAMADLAERAATKLER